MIQAGKFENRRSVWKLLAREMAILFQKIHLEEGRVLIPLPISKKRRRERGFNQSAIIAKHLSRQFQIPCYENILHKTKHNTAQFSLSLGERKKNPVGCYEVQNRELIKEKTIILIDDVFTTGSTVNECAKVLKGGGAFRVIALTVARVGLKSNE
jgi:ComF family protein